jgi:putative flippase GtrA
MQGLKLFSRFLCVGLLGAFINIIIFSLAVKIFMLPINTCSILAFLVAVFSNFYLNNSWTFPSSETKVSVIKNKLIFFFLCNFCGLALNLIILNLVLYFFNQNAILLAQGIGIFFGMVVNFFLTKKFVF